MIYAFARFYQDREAIQDVLGEAEVVVGDLDLRGTPYAVWRRIVEFVDNNDQAAPLIAVFRSRQAGNQEIADIEKDFATGNETKYSMIVRAIKAQQCVLFLGPGAFQCRVDGNTIPFSQALALHFEKALNRDGVPYDENHRTDLKYMAQRFHAKKTYIAGEAGKVAKEFYDLLETSGMLVKDLFGKLARLPFPLIINTNPDNLLFAELTPAKAVSRYYNLSNSGKPSEQELQEDKNDAFWQDKTTIYNIFGSFDRPQSILFTEANFVNFTKRVFLNNPPLHDRVVNEFDPFKYYLFLGFEFSQWHLKILFEVFNLVRTEPRSISLYIDKPTIADHEMDYFEREFHCFFCNQDMYPLVEALLKKLPTIN